MEENGNNEISKPSRRHSHVRFVNMTFRKVDVIWMNFEGVRVKYRSLEPNEYFDVTSFVTHNWIFLDSETHSRLVVSSKEVFEVPEQKFLRSKNGSTVPTRLCVRITIPLFTLKECSLQLIQKSIKCPTDAYSLEIPKFLQKEIYKRAALTQAHCGFPSQTQPSPSSSSN